MRDLIHTVEKAYTPLPLMESLLLEYHGFGQNKLSPAFAALYEVQMSKRDATDRMLAQLLQKHGNNVQAVVTAVLAHKQSKTAKTSDTDSDLDIKQKNALATLKHAMQELPKLAGKADQLVEDPDKFIKNKAEQIKARLEDKIGPTSKFQPAIPKLKQYMDRLVQISKDHPKKTSWVIAGLGILGGLLTAGGPWVGGAITATIKLILMLIQGRPFSESAKEILKSTGISILLGFGIGSALTAIDSMFNSVQAAGSSGAVDALSQTDSVRELSSGPSAPAPNADRPLATTPYIERLKDLVNPTGEGKGIPTMNQSRFADAYRAARDAMGPGNIFVWNGNAYTTNTSSEGLLSGLSDNVKRFLRGTR